MLADRRDRAEIRRRRAAEHFGALDDVVNNAGYGHFGIDVTLIEPGGYSTDWVGPSARRSEENEAHVA